MTELSPEYVVDVFIKERKDPITSHDVKIDDLAELLATYNILGYQYSVRTKND